MTAAHRDTGGAEHQDIPADTAVFTAKLAAAAGFVVGVIVTLAVKAGV